MSGQAVVTIGAKQWQVYLATTPQELAQGLGGLASMPAGTGMLFDTGFEQIITVTTIPMLFPIDVVFINSSLVVVDMALNVAPGKLVTSEAPARYFLEVSGGEAAGVKVGDTVGLQLVSSAAQNNTLVDFAAALLTMGLVLSGGRLLMKAALAKPKPKAEVYGLRAAPLLPRTESKPTRHDVSVHSWVERDRIGIWIVDNRTDRTLIEWWDEDAAQMFEDGFFKSGRIQEQKITGREFEASVLSYAEYIGVLEKPKSVPLSYLPQTIERGEVVEIPLKEAPAWLQEEWKRLHPGSIPRVRVYRTTVARIHSQAFEYATRDIVAHKDGRTMTKYVPAYESLLAVTPEERALYFGGAIKLGADEAIAVMDFWGDRFKSIDLYVHPEAYQPPKLVAPTLTDRQMKILATIRGYASAYRKEVFHTHKVTQSELDELQRLGLIDRRGAITAMGRNVVGRGEPLTAYLPSVAIMPRLPEEARGDVLFVEYIRDLVRLGERVSNEEARRMWEVWEKQRLSHAMPRGSTPHVIGATQRRQPPKELEFFADSCQQCQQSVNGTGLRPQLEKTFKEAIARAKDRL